MGISTASNQAKDLYPGYAMGSLTRLAEQLLEQAKKVDAYLESNKHPPASFAEYNLDRIPADVAVARDAIINGCSDLRALVEQPQETTVNIAGSWTDILTVRFLVRYQIAQAVPLTGSATYAEIGRRVKLSENLVFRFIRHAMFFHFFDESAPGQVCHTFLSRRLATDSGFRDSIGLHAEDFTDASIRYFDTLEKFGESGEPNESAFALAHCQDPSQSIYNWFAANPAKAKRFAGAMQFYTSGDTWSLEHLYNSFDWAKWDRPDRVMIDVAGGNGHVTYFLAQRTRNLKYIVQDLPHVTTPAAAAVPVELQNRVLFMPQNFLEPNKAKPPADIVFLRWILHNWSDKYAVQILQNLIPCLHPGSKVLIFEFVLDDRPTRARSEKMRHLADIVMEVGFAGKERTEAQYREIVAKADERFVVEGVRKMGRSSLSLVEITWVGDEAQAPGVEKVMDLPIRPVNKPSLMNFSRPVGNTNRPVVNGNGTAEHDLDPAEKMRQAKANNRLSWMGPDGRAHWFDH